MTIILEAYSETWHHVPFSGGAAACLSCEQSTSCYRMNGQAFLVFSHFGGGDRRTSVGFAYERCYTTMKPGVAVETKAKFS